MNHWQPPLPIRFSFSSLLDKRTNSSDEEMPLRGIEIAKVVILLCCCLEELYNRLAKELTSFSLVLFHLVPSATFLLTKEMVQPY